MKVCEGQVRSDCPSNTSASGAALHNSTDGPSAKGMHLLMFQHLDMQGQDNGRSASSPSPCVLTRSSWCSTPQGSLRPRSLFSQGHLSSGPGCTRMASSQLSHLLKGAVSKPSPSGVALASSCDLEGKWRHKSAQSTDQPSVFKPQRTSLFWAWASRPSGLATSRANKQKSSLREPPNAHC